MKLNDLTRTGMGLAIGFGLQCAIIIWLHIPIMAGLGGGALMMAGMFIGGTGLAPAQQGTRAARVFRWIAGTAVVGLDFFWIMYAMGAFKSPVSS
jgi:hypothetical protein